MITKRSTLSFILLFYTLSLYSQMNNTSKWFLLPQKTETKLCTFVNNKIMEITVIDVPQNSKYAIDENDFVVNLDLDTIYICQINEKKESIKYYPKLPIPPTIAADCIAIKDGIIYIGGKKNQGHGEILLLYDIKKEEWRTIPIPAEIITGYTKSIDDLLIEKDILIAVDDIASPKYLIEYTIQNPSSPVLSKVQKLENSGPYEHIQKGSSNSNYIALLSTSSGLYEISNIIAIYSKKRNYQNPFIWLTSKKQGETSTKSNKKNNPNIGLDPFYEWKDILLIENHLFIAAKEEGIGHFIFSDSLFKSSSDQSKFIQNYIEKYHGIINYIKQKEGSVVKLQAIPNNTHFFIAIIQYNGIYTYKLIPTSPNNEKK